MWLRGGIAESSDTFLFAADMAYWTDTRIGGKLWGWAEIHHYSRLDFRQTIHHDGVAEIK